MSFSDQLANDGQMEYSAALYVFLFVLLVLGSTVWRVIM